MNSEPSSKWPNKPKPSGMDIITTITIITHTSSTKPLIESPHNWASSHSKNSTPWIPTSSELGKPDYCNLLLLESSLTSFTGVRAL